MTTEGELLRNSSNDCSSESRRSGATRSNRKLLSHKFGISAKGKCSKFVLKQREKSATQRPPMMSSTSFTSFVNSEKSSFAQNSKNLKCKSRIEELGSFFVVPLIEQMKIKLRRSSQVVDFASFEILV